jgi:cyd operon protein YbgT
MWYFTWILGVLLAVSLGIINVLWLESEQCMGDDDDNTAGD